MSFGIVAVMNLTNDFRISRDSYFRSFIVDPMLELGLAEMVVDRNKRAAPDACGCECNCTHLAISATYEYRFPMSGPQPFVAAGPSLRTYSNPSGSRHLTTESLAELD